MRILLDKMRQNFVLRVCLIYAAVALVIVQLVNVSAFYFSTRLSPDTVATLAVADFLLLFYFVWIIRAASSNDRRLWFVQVAWVMGPFVLGTHLSVILGDYFLFSEYPVTLTLTFLLILVTTIMWGQISGPFASAWVRRRAEDREVVKTVEQKLSWPFKPDEAQELEAQISPRLYYTFLACVFGMFFLVAETLIGKFLDDAVGSVDYIGAILIALSVTAIVYPIHRRTRKYISLDQENSIDSVANDFRSAASEVVRAFVSLLKAIKRYWYIFVPVFLAGFYVGSFENVAQTKKLKLKARHQLSRLEPTIKILEDGGRICGIGIRSMESQRISRLSEQGKTIGLRRGDRLLKIDGESIEGHADNYLSRFSPGEKVTILVQRGTEEIYLNATCDDGTKTIQALVSVFESINDGRWTQCIEYTYELDRQNGGPTGFSAIFRRRCNDAKRCGLFSCKSPTKHDADLVFESRSFSMEQFVTFKALDNFRPSVLSDAVWLNENGFQSLSAELDSRLKEAEARLTTSGID